MRLNRLSAPAACSMRAQSLQNFRKGHCRIHPAARVTEEVAGLGRYGKTLTVLSSEVIGQELPDLDDEGEDNDLRERWTPRFRK